MEISDLNGESVLEGVENNFHTLWCLAAAVGWLIITMGAFELRETGSFRDPGIVYIVTALSTLVWVLRLVIRLLRNRSPFDEKMQLSSWAYVIAEYVRMPSTVFQVAMIATASALVLGHAQSAWVLAVGTNIVLSFIAFRHFRR
jgi:hypothetical protein